EALHQPFKGNQEINRLLKKLQNAQLYNGGWGWWEQGSASLPVTAYIIEALLPLRKTPLVETTIRNGLLFLQNQLTLADRTGHLQVLACLSNAGHLMDYKTVLADMHFDSLSLHQQWQWVQICQQQQLPHTTLLEQLISRQQNTMT